jgi:hypothetical protein
MSDGLQPGHLIEVSIWLSGKEAEIDLLHWKCIILEDRRRRFEHDFEFELGPWQYEEKRPGGERVPQVPKHISGPDVRLLVATATVGKSKPRIEVKPALPFAEDLTVKDRMTLRKITREAWAKAHPEQRLSDRNCDEIINGLGPDVAVKTLRGFRA